MHNACGISLSIEPIGGGRFRLEARQWLPRVPEDLFAFFADAANLERITPPFLHFRILSPLPVQMQVGAQIRYALRLHGLPVRWLTRITAWDPPYGFEDTQLRGPYRLWRHRHRFVESRRGSDCFDCVDYLPRGGTLVNRLFVERNLKQIFEYRGRRLAEIFQAGGAAGGGAQGCEVEASGMACDSSET